VRAGVAGSRIRRQGSTEPIGTVTVSLGIAERQPGELALAWVDRADQALYASKMGGRNRVTLAAVATARPPVLA
jgi:diguanylate cyclase